MTQERVFTVEAPGLTSGEVAAILERAIADGVYEIPDRRAGRAAITVGPLRGRVQGRALAGQIVALSGAQAGLWAHPGVTNPELAIEGTVRDTADGAELRVVLRPASIRPTVIGGLALTAALGAAVLVSEPTMGGAVLALAMFLFPALLAGPFLVWGQERALGRSFEVHRFLTRVLRAGATGEPGWREATWR